MGDNNKKKRGVDGEGSSSSSRRGAWIVRTRKKNGEMWIKYRHPSEKERQINKERERRRRQVAKNIFEGLRKHGNYTNLPKHPNSNQLLIALCQEAGWHVDEDGNITRIKQQQEANTSSLYDGEDCTYQREETLSLSLPNSSSIPTQKP